MFTKAKAKYNYYAKLLYNLFKSSYKIPKNLLDEQMNDTYLKYYYSDTEKQNYYNEWLNKSSASRNSYTFEQYKLYEELTIENSYIDIIQLHHYFDEGCICKACSIKRYNTKVNILKGYDVKDRIIHNNAKTELIQQRVIRANKINNIISKIPVKTRGKNFKQDLMSIVSKK